MVKQLIEFLSLPFARHRTRLPATPLPLERFLQDELDRHLDPWPQVVDLLAEKAAAQGVRLSKRDRRRFEEALRQGGGVANLQLSSWKWWDKSSMTVDVGLTEAEGETVVAKLDAILDRLPEAIPEVIDATAPSLLEALRDSYRSAIREDERDFRQLERSIGKVWREPLESLALLIELAFRSGFTVQDFYADQVPTEPHLFDVLRRLHTRGIHIAREIHVLLRSGYADAAMARWRTLHEVAVVSSFVAEHGEVCAQRYLDHDAVESSKFAKQYQAAAARLGFPLPTDEQLTEIRADLSAALARYGATFERDYGWAEGFMQPDPTKFADLETAVEMDHLRPFYRFAGHNVHANPKGVLFKLGSPEPGLLLIGPSPYGLADPGQNTALSLAVLIAHLGRMCPAVDALMGAKVALLLARETADRFVAVQGTFEADETPRPGS